MPKTKEFSIRMEDEPGTLGKVCGALADAKVNILAFQSIPWEKKSLVRFVVDNPTTAKSVLDTQKLKYTEAEVAQVRLPHQPGELARAALQLGEAEININYAYCGIEAGTNAPLLIFGVADVGRAVKILDKAAAAAAGA
ncbi:MAG TPA: ACT domain-containing protein [Pyrinomonadaceae bacterium]|nr:ACT domain-containing protein [Pyrinomonadaceae bacterium]